MTNYIVGAFLVVFIIIGIIYTVKHFKGESSCCGGGGYKTKKKKLSNVIMTKIFIVEGMHCVNCKNRVEEVVNDMKGVSGEVNLKKKKLKVSYAEQVDDSVLISAIERAGYKVVEKYTLNK